MSDGNVYEMLWDCQFCGTKGNLGLTHRFCPNCGAPQNPDSRYYPSDDEKVAVHDHHYVGVDVTCPHCSELNSAAAEFCGQCGSPLTEGAEAKTLDAQVRKAEEQFESSGSRDLVKEKFDAEMQRVGVKPKKKPRSGPNVALIVVIVGLVVAVIAVIAALTATHETTVIVTGHEWERTIHIDEYRDFSVRDWRDSPPAGDNVSIVPLSCERQQRDTLRVPDGEECSVKRVDQGDGTFREEQECRTIYRDEPVYDDMCTWTGQRWEFERDERASGTSLAEPPYWPDVSLNCEDQRRVGCEQASHEEIYNVLYAATEGNRTYRCNFPQSTWQGIQIESLWKGAVRAIDGGGLRCDSLEAAN